MYADTNQVLYKNSPFLPNLDDEIARKISKNIAKGIHPANVIAFYLGEINISNRALLADEIPWICETFQASERDIDYYFLGFSTVPHLIFGAWYAQHHSLEKSIEVVCVPSPEPSIILYNRYKTRSLPQIVRYFEPFISDPMITAAPIYSFCRVHPLNNDPWYLVGLEASERLFTEYSSQVSPSRLPHPTS